MKPILLTLKQHGQLTIPKHVREVLNLNEGNQLELTIEEGRIVLQPVVTIAKGQQWFWSPEWQQGELEAEEDVVNEHVTTFETSNEALAFLRRNKN